MIKKIMLGLFALLLISGCTSKQLKGTGGAMSNNPLGLVVGLPLYGIGVLVENKENEDNKIKEAENHKQMVEKDFAHPLIEEKIEETTKQEEIKK